MSEKQIVMIPEFNKRDSALGWLIAQTKTHTQTYDLTEGVQTIGRKSNSRPVM